MGQRLLLVVNGIWFLTAIVRTEYVFNKLILINFFILVNSKGILLQIVHVDIG